MSDVTIYHNPRCSTSRAVLALIRETGTEPTIVKYLEDPPSREELAALIRDSGLAPRQALRRREKLYKELGLDDPGLTEEAALDAMVANPVLIERPFVRAASGSRLARPAETVRELL
ncbi:arsenate reductase (glutaredoxin) [Hoyosella sp. G463]|uniref:arsenate reductase (glutathione/glutaredoxin) n=1 Tax=Lolliginicoccus lacisalsi TaxID=2742202 RepID=A0A927JBD3_9ACTN|nr:arsenate reductase (glutaredoxin) [Lolliginicoccus lacisalsi]MBD8506141.1 arsenate reductase (glutaredoxin) [Lolliginicoccus lacisalsi]